jgi:protein SCO1/2
MGYSVRDRTAGDAIAHSAGFVVATPDGRIARYFPGVRFDAPGLRMAVIEAAGGRIGSLNERLTLLCGHYDPVSGRYSLAIMGWLRTLGCAGALALAFWVWRPRRAPAPPPPPP